MDIILTIVITSVCVAWLTTKFNTLAVGLANKELMRQGKMYIKLDGKWLPRNPHRDNNEI